METSKGIKTGKTHQESTLKVKPGKEHLWLGKLVGQWTFEGEAAMEPGGPPTKFKGTETVRSLGVLWIIAEGNGECPGGGGEATTIMTLGYDPVKKRYVGTFIGSMMTHLWIYDGELNPAGNVLTLISDGPSFTEEGKMVKYKDVIEIRNDDYRVLSSKVLGDDGKWHGIMTADYRRLR